MWVAHLCRWVSASAGLLTLVGSRSRRTSPYKRLSNQASIRWWKAGDETRTRDIDLGRVALYQLSYSRSDTRFGRKDVAEGLLHKRFPPHVPENAKIPWLRKRPKSYPELAAPPIIKP